MWRQKAAERVEPQPRPQPIKNKRSRDEHALCIDCNDVGEGQCKQPKSCKFRLVAMRLQDARDRHPPPPTQLPIACHPSGRARMPCTPGYE